MKMTREFAELLKGCRPIKDGKGNIVVQSIMNMQLVCLTTDPEFSLDDRFANPMTALVAGNGSYGQIIFKNKEVKEVIIPTQMAIMTKQSAQNHGMTKAGYVPAKTQITFNDAGCVQGSQGGHFSNTQEYRFIPVTMREMLYDTVGKNLGYSRIYPAIDKLGRDTQSNAGSYLNIYFDKYDKKLEQFIAHFERPKNFIGMIVLIDGEIIAIDKFPSFTFAEQVWDGMIRDCYGSLAIISELKNKTQRKLFTETFDSMIGSGKDDLITLLSKALNKTKQFISTNVQSRIEELMDITFDSTLDCDGNPRETSDYMKSYILKSEGYIGQVLTESDFNHLVSIVKKEAFNSNALRIVTELKAKARRQSDFKL